MNKENRVNRTPAEQLTINIKVHHAIGGLIKESVIRDLGYVPRNQKKFCVFNNDDDLARSSALLAEKYGLNILRCKLNSTSECVPLWYVTEPFDSLINSIGYEDFLEAFITALRYSMASVEALSGSSVKLEEKRCDTLQAANEKLKFEVDELVRYSNTLIEAIAQVHSCTCNWCLACTTKTYDALKLQGPALDNKTND